MEGEESGCTHAPPAMPSEAHGRGLVQEAFEEGRQGGGPPWEDRCKQRLVGPAFGEDVVAPTVEVGGEGVGSEAPVNLAVKEGDEAGGAEPLPGDGGSIADAQDEGDGEDGEEEEAFPGPVALAGPQTLQVGSSGPSAWWLAGWGGFAQGCGDKPVAGLHGWGDKGEFFQHADGREEATGSGIAGAAGGEVQQTALKGWGEGFGGV